MFARCVKSAKFISPFEVIFPHVKYSKHVLILSQGWSMSVYLVSKC